MKRRILIMSGVGALAASAGCLGLFDDEEETEPEESQELPDGFPESGTVPTELLEEHRSQLLSQSEFEVSISITVDESTTQITGSRSGDTQEAVFSDDNEVLERSVEQDESVYSVSQPERTPSYSVEQGEIQEDVLLHYSRLTEVLQSVGLSVETFEDELVQYTVTDVLDEDGLSSAFRTEISNDDSVEGTVDIRQSGIISAVSVSVGEKTIEYTVSDSASIDDSLISVAESEVESEFSARISPNTNSIVIVNGDTQLDAETSILVLDGDGEVYEVETTEPIEPNAGIYVAIYDDETIEYETGQPPTPIGDALENSPYNVILLDEEQNEIEDFILERAD